MGKKKGFELPFTMAESAEKRLEELILNKSITRYAVVFEDENYGYYHPVRGEARAYPDGFELIWKSGTKETGMLHIERRRMFIHYDLEKEYEKKPVEG